MSALGRAYRLWWSEFNRAQKVLLGVMAGCVVLVFVSLAAGLIPFEPMRFYGYSAEPGVSCPGEEVRTVVDTEVREPPLGRVGRLEVATSWEATDGRLTPTVEDEMGLEPWKRRERESRILRTAPRDPGEWKIQSTLTVTGSVLGFGRTQELEVESGPLLTVLGADDPRCEG